MIYRGYKINADVQTWDTYDLNQDGTLGEYSHSGGGDTDFPMYAVWSLDEDGDEMDGLGEYDTIAEAKKAIDEIIVKETTFQNEAGN